jgi:cobyrinic acid a,c-diamide synthase
MIESMGALFDGEDGSERGSGAHIAKLVGAEIILVVDVWGMTRSVIPLLDGFMSFDKHLTFAGFVLNRVGSKRHAQMILGALPENLQRLCLGHIPRRRELEIPERHLGLLTVDENPISEPVRRAALDAAVGDLRIEHLLPPPPIEPAAPRRASRTNRTRIAIARDRAFCFYYAENLDALERAGAELCSFSPTNDTALPDAISGIYIGGGYPESFITELSTNNTLKTQIASLAASGMPVFAECGGFMYLARSLQDNNGKMGQMVGIFDLDILMDPTHLAIKYVTVCTTVNSPLGPAATIARGQEFHQSRAANQGLGTALFKIITSDGKEYFDGRITERTVGSYIHLHFASNPTIPLNFVETSLNWYRGVVG